MLHSFHMDGCFISRTEKLCQSLDLLELDFDGYIYNPLEYARNMYERYQDMALSGEKQQVVVNAALRDAEKPQRGQRASILVQGAQQAMATVESIGAAVTDATTGQVTCEVVLSLDQSLDLPLGAQVEVEVEKKEKTQAESKSKSNSKAKSKAKSKPKSNGSGSGSGNEEKRRDWEKC